MVFCCFDPISIVTCITTILSSCSRVQQITSDSVSRFIHLGILVFVVIFSVFSPAIFPLDVLDPNGDCATCLLKKGNQDTASIDDCNACSGRLFSMKLMLSVAATYGIFALISCISDACSISSKRGSWLQKFFILFIVFLCLEFIPAHFYVLVGYVIHFVYAFFLIFIAMEAVGMSYATARFLQECNSDAFETDISRSRSFGLLSLSGALYVASAFAIGLITTERMIHGADDGTPCHGSWTCGLVIAYICLWGVVTLFLSMAAKVREFRASSGMMHAALMCALTTIMVSITLTSEPKWFTRGCHLPKRSHAMATFAGETNDFSAFMLIEILIILAINICNTWRFSDIQHGVVVSVSGEDNEDEDEEGVVSRVTTCKYFSKLSLSCLALAHVIVCGTMPSTSSSLVTTPSVKMTIPVNYPWFSIENALGSLAFGAMYVWFLVAPIILPERDF